MIRRDHCDFVERIKQSVNVHAEALGLLEGLLINKMVSLYHDKGDDYIAKKITQARVETGLFGHMVPGLTENNEDE